MKLILIVAGIIIGLVLGWWFCQTKPIVYRDTGSQAKVACKSEETNWESTSIKSPACIKVLTSNYEVVWVAPGRRP